MYYVGYGGKYNWRSGLGGYEGNEGGVRDEKVGGGILKE